MNATTLPAILTIETDNENGVTVAVVSVSGREPKCYTSTILSAIATRHPALFAEWLALMEQLRADMERDLHFSMNIGTN